MAVVLRAIEATVIVCIAASVIGCPNPNHCTGAVPPDNIHLHLVDASTGQPIDTTVFLGIDSYGCTSQLELELVGVKDITIKATGYVPATVTVDGGGELRDCNIVWPTHDVTMTVALTPDTTWDGGTCDNAPTHD